MIAVVCDLPWTLAKRVLILPVNPLAGKQAFTWWIHGDVLRHLQSLPKFDDDDIRLDAA